MHGFGPCVDENNDAVGGSLQFFDGARQSPLDEVGRVYHGVAKFNLALAEAFGGSTKDGPPRERHRDEMSSRTPYLLGHTLVDKGILRCYGTSRVPDLL